MAITAWGLVRWRQYPFYDSPFFLLFILSNEAEGSNWVDDHGIAIPIVSVPPHPHISYLAMVKGCMVGWDHSPTRRSSHRPPAETPRAVSRT